MSQAVARIFHEAAVLPAKDRAELADKLINTLGGQVDSGTESARLAEVRRRIERTKLGETVPINGPEGLARVRQKVEFMRKS